MREKMSVIEVIQVTKLSHLAVWGKKLFRDRNVKLLIFVLLIRI